MRPYPSAVFVPALSLLAACLLLATHPLAASAFEMPGCGLELTSYDAAGQALDQARSGDEAGTLDSPLAVDWDGRVTWSVGAEARKQAPPGAWDVSVFGIPTPMRGDTAATSGSVEVGAGAPFRWAGLFQLTGRLEAGGEECRGEGWIRVRGSPIGTIPFLASLALSMLGVVLAAAGIRGHALLAAAGGLLLGVGAALLAVMFGFMPLGAVTPAGVASLGLVGGVLAGLSRSGPRARSSPARPGGLPDSPRPGATARDG